MLEKAGVAPAALARVILDSPNPRAADEIVRGMKLDPAKMSDTLALTVGQTGAAHAGLMLTAALPSLKSGRPDIDGRRWPTAPTRSCCG